MGTRRMGLEKAQEGIPLAVRTRGGGNFSDAIALQGDCRFGGLPAVAPSSTRKLKVFPCSYRYNKRRLPFLRGGRSKSFEANLLSVLIPVRRRESFHVPGLRPETQEGRGKTVKSATSFSVETLRAKQQASLQRSVLRRGSVGGTMRTREPAAHARAWVAWLVRCSMRVGAGSLVSGRFR